MRHNLFESNITNTFIIDNFHEFESLAHYCLYHKYTSNLLKHLDEYKVLINEHLSDQGHQAMKEAATRYNVEYQEGTNIFDAIADINTNNRNHRLHKEYQRIAQDTLASINLETTNEIREKIGRDADQVPIDFYCSKDRNLASLRNFYNDNTNLPYGLDTIEESRDSDDTSPLPTSTVEDYKANDTTPDESGATLIKQNIINRMIDSVRNAVSRLRRDDKTFPLDHNNIHKAPNVCGSEYSSHPSPRSASSDTTSITDRSDNTPPNSDSHRWVSRPSISPSPSRPGL